MKFAFLALALIAAAPLANAQGNGEHPAVVARRVIAAQGYDYASKFYLHPAGLRILSEPASSAAVRPFHLAVKPAGYQPDVAAR